MKHFTPHQPNNIRLYLLAAGLFVAIVGINVYTYQQHSKDNEQLSSLAAESPLSTSSPSAVLPVEQVKSLAAREAPHTAVAKIELTNKDQKLVYIVSLANKTQLVLDAATGAKLANAPSATKPAKDSLPADLKPSINFLGARDIALTHKPAGVINKIELEPVGNQAVYKVYFSDGSKLDIGATDGAVQKPASPPQADTPPSSSNASDSAISSSTNTQADDTSASDNDTDAPAAQTDDTDPQANNTGF